MGVQLICAFTEWRQPIAALRDPLPPFPDIPFEGFFDIADALGQLKPQLRPENRAAFEQSYQRIFEPLFSVFDDDEDSGAEEEEEDEGEASADNEGDEDETDPEEGANEDENRTVYSPADAAAITAAVERFPAASLRTALIDASDKPRGDRSDIPGSRFPPSWRYHHWPVASRPATLHRAAGALACTSERP